MKKKSVFIVVGIVLVFFAVFIAYRIMNPIYTFDDITNNKAELVDRIESRECSEEHSMELLNFYKEQNYKVYKSDSYGSTTQYSLAYFDKNNMLLFKIRDIGNQNIIVVTVDGTTRSYIGF